MRAFTLIELLVSMSVLVLLLLVIVQMVNSALALTMGSTKRLDADSQVRLAFDRMAVDFSQVAKRSDVDYYFQKNLTSGTTLPGDDQMAFYSETTGYYAGGVSGPVPKSNAALVGYRIFKPTSSSPTSAPPFRRLERLDKALVWNGVTTSTSGVGSPVSTSSTPQNLQAMRFLPQTLLAAWPGILTCDTTPTSDPTAGGAGDPDPYYQVIGEQIFRMEICYLVYDKTLTPPAYHLSVTPYVSSSVPPVTITANTTPLPYNALKDVVAVVVTLAVLDNTSHQVIQPAALDAAACLLEDVTASSLTSNPTAAAAQLWQHHIDNNDLSTASPSGTGVLPPNAASQVRIYERYFYLGNAR